MNLVLLGPPGAGKGTQANLICKKYNLARNSSCIETLSKPRFICYTFLINNNLFNIPDIELISYIFENHLDSIKNIVYFHDYDLVV